ncbi:uncharacterized protein LOC127509707 [Ctenopharyngodon idella]|uniref:uncharacterized protein LOC127509707 n=1 Tax=Ctenopharyngodon idella TaxID=7959 RepID=UPI00222FFF8D|nr:uncharacterized protein LOC127509707 [Ctenopharyngodon idella]
MNFIHEQEKSQPCDCTLYKKGTKPPSVTLDEVAKNVLMYIGGSHHLNKTEKQIETKYSFKKECDGCWSEDNIKRAWGKTQRMNDTSLKRKRWTLAILLQVIKRSSGFNEFKDNTSDQLQAEKDIVRSKGSASKSQLPSSNEKEQNRGGSNKPNSQNFYIRIPLSVMFRNESTYYRGGGSKDKDSTIYKLIDRFPLVPEIKKKTSYVMLYNNQTRNAAWVYEILNKSTLATASVKDKDCKYVDDIKNPLYQAAKSTEGCDESDYEQGHLAAAANHRWCKEAYKDTFFLSNIVPQDPHLNQGMWKQLEDYCQGKSKENGVRNVHVYSGPLYLRSDEKKKHEILKIWRTKVVPTHFFKVVIVENEDGTVEMECYEMPNTSEDKNKQSKDKNKQSKDKNKQSKDENKQSKDKNHQSKDKNKQSKDKNDQSKDQNVLQSYKVSVAQIEEDSGLRFTESSCIEGEIDSTRTVKWEGKDRNEGSCSAKIKVRISTPLTDHNDFIYI